MFTIKLIVECVYMLDSFHCLTFRQETKALATGGKYAALRFKDNDLSRIIVKKFMS